MSVIGTDGVNRVQVYSQDGQMLFGGAAGNLATGTKYIYLGNHVIAEVSGAGSDTLRGAGMVKLSGLQLRACAVALEDFKPRGYLLEHFEIIVVDRPMGYEVIFIPEHPKDQAASRGGSTVFGKEIHYMISKSGKIKTVTFGR